MKEEAKMIKKSSGGKQPIGGSNETPIPPRNAKSGESKMNHSEEAQFEAEFVWILEKMIGKENISPEMVEDLSKMNELIHKAKPFGQIRSTQIVSFYLVMRGLV